MAACTAAASSLVVGSTLGPSQAVTSSSSSLSVQSLESLRHGVPPFSSSFTASSPLCFRPFSSSVSCSLLPSRSSPFCRRGRSEVLSTLMMLPSQFPDRVSSSERAKIGRWSARAIKSFSMAELEARKLKYPTTGSETILMGKDDAAFNLIFESTQALETARHYEVVFLVDRVEEVQDVIQKVKDFIEEKKGKIFRINDWGMRKLAYKIKKAKRANYILMNIQIGGKEINDFKSLLDKDERVIRHLVITMKKAETKEIVPPPEFSSIRDEVDLDEEDSEEEYEETDDEAEEVEEVEEVLTKV